MATRGSNKKSDAVATPRGQQIRQYILEQIIGGQWVAGQRVPSEAELVAHFDCARMTVHYALKELRDEGYLVRVRGAGTFVASPHVHVAVFKLTDLADDAATLGRQHSLHVISKFKRPANQGEALELRISQGDPVYHITVLHLLDATPAQLERRVINGRALPDFLASDFTKTTPFRVLMESVPYPEGRLSIRAVVPHAEDRRALKMPAGAACLEVERVTWSRGTVYAQTRILIRDPTSLVGKITPPVGVNGGRDARNSG
jgi:GntR family histidine utilization transcriptional repressor